MTNSNRFLSAFSLRVLPIAGGLVLILTCLTGGHALGADEPGVITKTKDSVQQASRAAVDEAEQLWQHIDAVRLKNRTRDEVVAWVIMGVLVGGLAGMMTPLKPTGLGKLARLLLGLAGAFLGGIVVRATRLDLGWGPVLIRYEELFASFLGAILLIVLVRVISSRFKKKASKS